MRKSTISAVLLLFIISMLMSSATAQEVPEKSIFFSTEEDFVTQGSEPPDGNPIVSDGDLLNLAGHIYARNRELLGAFDVRDDLGLDAVDVIDVDDRFVAFSTELDHPNGLFTAGDLLATNGAILSNSALLAAFQIPSQLDLGLDAVHFLGKPEDIISFLRMVRDRGRHFWLDNPVTLSKSLEEYDIDIWFSTEGTPPPLEKPMFLDGDLLSATGTVVGHNTHLLPAVVPAGIPNRGVDFGLDAVNADREGHQSSIHFCTEILFEGEFSFTDGDVLEIGRGVVIRNAALTKVFKPRSEFLGLDALSFTLKPRRCENQITDIGGLQVDVADINPAGRAEIIPMVSTDHPFGKDVPFWGTICPGTIRFRVVFRKFVDGPGPGTGIPVLPAEGWMAKGRNMVTGACDVLVPWFSDADGWFDGPRFRQLLFCNPNLILTWWKSESAPDPNGLYRVWLEFDRGAGIETEPMSHLVRLDNTSPKINSLGIPGGACIEYSSTDMPIMVKSDFFDEHFWRYQLVISGDLYPDNPYAGVHYYDTVPEAANLKSTGTKPPGTLVNLHEVSVFDVVKPPAKPVACAYGVRLRVWDRTVDGYVQPHPHVVGGYFRTYVSREIYFDYTP